MRYVVLLANCDPKVTSSPLKPSVFLSGYTKFPAERGIYETVLKSNRLHKSIGKKGFSINEPEKGFNSFTKNLSDLFSS